MTKRTKNLVVRLTDDEHGMAVAIAEARSEPMTMVIRKLLRQAYVDVVGVELPPKKKTAK